MKFRGRQLAPLYVIFTRLALLPVLFVLRCVICTVLLIGWGVDEAQRIWDELA